MAQVARISGPLLAANLQRTQANLSVDTDLLFIGHLTGKIGVRTATPSTELNITGQHSANHYYADRLTGGNIKIDTTGASSVVGNIILNSQGIIKTDKLRTENLEFNDNTIGSLSNANIVLSPNGAGTVEFRTNTQVQGNINATGNITIPGNISVGGTINLGDQATDTIDFDFLDFTQDLVPNSTTGLHNLGSATKIWNNINTAKANIGDIEIDNDYISTSTFNNNMFLRANGTGSILLHDLEFNGHNIKTEGTGAPGGSYEDIQFTPGSENLTISSVQALKVPVGGEGRRPNLNRDVRYNADTNFFELFSTAYTPLRGIWSEDRQTYILANAGNDFSFVTNGSTTATLNSTELSTIKLVSQDNVSLDGNTISSASTNADIQLTANGTGVVNIANFKIEGSTIHNTIAQAFQVSKTGTTGYIHFDSTIGAVIPAGSTSQRPAGIIGQTRFNTQLAYVETFDGTIWSNIAGAGGGITLDYMDELVNIYTIALA
jgi:hypothetical protein|tara:strand:+ start:6621 stop:8096 length:1476 start_codon:yes stop_codon:yes gene_type:complete